MSKYVNTDSIGKTRCNWCGEDPLYVKYHDKEWGHPVKQDQKLFEKICLEGFQSGLSWITILKKRENFRAAFAAFDIETVAKFRQRDVNRLLKDAGIVRHQGKIKSTINNARLAIDLIEAKGSLAAFVWSYEPKPKKFNPKITFSDQSTQMSKDLKKLGWSFVGPTTCYAFMESMGMINNHHPACWMHQTIETKREKLKRPKLAKST